MFYGDTALMNARTLNYAIISRVIGRFFGIKLVPDQCFLVGILILVIVLVSCLDLDSIVGRAPNWDITPSTKILQF